MQIGSVGHLLPKHANESLFSLVSFSVRPNSLERRSHFDVFLLVGLAHLLWVGCGRGVMSFVRKLFFSPLCRVCCSVFVFAVVL